jgi:hypothetical protein
VGETLTYAAQRIFMSRHPLAREFSRSGISKVAIVNGDPPEDELYHRLLAGGFAEWPPSEKAEGRVSKPSTGRQTFPIFGEHAHVRLTEPRLQLP